MDRLPPLNALRAFEAAARHGSFTLAAHELCVTPGAISRQIRALEDHFRQPLFLRDHKRVTLNEAGQRYYALISGPFADLARASASLRTESEEHSLCLDCVPTLAMHWLLPRLERFRHENPDIQVVLQTSLGPADPASGFDLSIRRDPTHFSGLAATPLMTEWCLPTCSPDYGRTHALAEKGALRRASILTIRARPDLWPSWCQAQGMALSELGPRLEVDHTFVALQAAEDGLGVAVVPLLFAHRALAAGRLICPLPDTEAISGTYSLLRSPTRRSPQAERFARWLTDECRTGNVLP